MELALVTEFCAAEGVCENAASQGWAVLAESATAALVAAPLGTEGDAVTLGESHPTAGKELSLYRYV